MCKYIKKVFKRSLGCVVWTRVYAKEIDICEIRCKRLRKGHQKSWQGK